MNGLCKPNHVVNHERQWWNRKILHGVGYIESIIDWMMIDHRTIDSWFLMLFNEQNMEFTIQYNDD